MLASFQNVFAIVLPLAMLPAVAALAEPPSVAATLINAPAVQAVPAATVPDEGPFQVMCVRACDGFYFPMRQNATRQSFAQDAQRCSAGCGGAASIYYFSAKSGGPDSMVDLSGRYYRDTPNAFSFRVRRDPACSCKPAPWSKEALSRHQAYERADVEERARQKQLTEELERAGAASESAALSGAASKAYYGQ